jgi:hypothetical protein
MRTEGQAEDRLTDTYRTDRRTGRVETGGQPRERDTDTEQKDERKEERHTETKGRDRRTGEHDEANNAFCDHAKVPKK